ncbi:hypothetical protein ACOSQ3_003957 [Xanthoceras sorbifolium]
MTLFNFFVIEEATESHQLTSVEIDFSFTQLILTYIDLVMKNKYDASLLPLAFAVILIVLVFKKDENVDSHRRHRISLLWKLAKFFIDQYCYGPDIFDEDTIGA